MARLCAGCGAKMPPSFRASPSPFCGSRCPRTIPPAHDPWREEREAWAQQRAARAEERAELRTQLAQVPDLDEHDEALAQRLFAWMERDGGWLGEPAMQLWADTHGTNLATVQRLLRYLVALDDVRVQNLARCPRWRAG